MSEPQSLSEKSVLDFLSDEPYTDLPAEVIAQGKRCLLDLLAVAAGGSVTSQASRGRPNPVRRAPSLRARRGVGERGDD